MKPARNQFYFLPSDRAVTRVFQTGVSLHSHTEHSRERLTCLPQYIHQMPVVGQFLHWEVEKYRVKTGRPVDFSRAYWRGPVCAQGALELERRQLERLGLQPIVSLTDHDNIDAGLLLQSQIPGGALLSVEWTVPYEHGFFHVGVHNLSPNHAVSFMDEMAAYTRCPQPGLLGALLEGFDADPAMLVVLNHPLWDIAGIGFDANLGLARKFLAAHSSRIHAVEINGLRSWQENLGACRIAEEFALPAISGGDRHGCEPNATLNLTRAATFAEFAAEIREDRWSDVAIMPQYHEPLMMRHLLCAWDVVRDHPQHYPERRKWIGRVFVECLDGVERPLSRLWEKGAPGWIEPCLRVMGFLASPQLRAAGRLAFPATGSALP